jgi:hypothetical protein
MLNGFIEWLVALVLALTVTAPQASTDNPWGGLTCWEDEVIVQVVHDPYDTSPGVGTYGCVAAGNLPTTGNRP